MREMERMRQLEQDLMSGNFETVSMEDMKDLLGQQALQDFQNLRQVMMMLQRSGYMVQKGDNMAALAQGRAADRPVGAA